MNVVTCNINLGFVTLYLNANILINLTAFVFYDYCFNILLIGGGGAVSRRYALDVLHVHVAQ